MLSDFIEKPDGKQIETIRSSIEFYKKHDHFEGLISALGWEQQVFVYDLPAEKWLETFEKNYEETQTAIQQLKNLKDLEYLSNKKALLFREKKKKDSKRDFKLMDSIVDHPALSGREQPLSKKAFKIYYLIWEEYHHAHDNIIEALKYALEQEKITSYIILAHQPRIKLLNRIVGYYAVLGKKKQAMKYIA